MTCCPCMHNQNNLHSEQSACDSVTLGNAFRYVTCDHSDTHQLGSLVVRPITEELFIHAPQGAIVRISSLLDTNYQLAWLDQQNKSECKRRDDESIESIEKEIKESPCRVLATQSTVRLC